MLTGIKYTKKRVNLDTVDTTFNLVLFGCSAKENFETNLHSCNLRKDHNLSMTHGSNCTLHKLMTSVIEMLHKQISKK